MCIDIDARLCCWYDGEVVTATRFPRPVLAGGVLDQAALEAAIHRFKALADPTRATILATLAVAAEPLCVCHINERVPLEQPTISHHLRVLREAGLVVSERRASWVYYALAPSARDWVAAALGCAPCDPRGGRP